MGYWWPFKVMSLFIPMMPFPILLLHLPPHPPPSLSIQFVNYLTYFGQMCFNRKSDHVYSNHYSVSRGANTVEMGKHWTCSKLVVVEPRIGSLFLFIKAFTGLVCREFCFWRLKLTLLLCFYLFKCWK